MKYSLQYNSTTNQVSAVTAVKLPAFSRENVKVWFIQTEFQFELKNITSEVSKSKHTVSALDPEVARDATHSSKILPLPNNIKGQANL